MGRGRMFLPFSFALVSAMIGIVNIKNQKILYTEKTPYGMIKIVDTEDQRILYINDHIESAVYNDGEKKNELVFPYMQRFSYAFAVHPEIKKTLLIGGGAFSYPRYYLNQYPDCCIDVVEISPEILRADETYFHLKQLLTERMHIITEDGFVYLAEHQDQYDLIINDAFLGGKEEGRDEKAMHVIHEHLCAHGIYMINTAAALKGAFSYEFHHVSADLKKEFKNTAVLPCEEDRSPYEKQNVLLIASDDSLL